MIGVAGGVVRRVVSFVFVVCVGMSWVGAGFGWIKKTRGTEQRIYRHSYERTDQCFRQVYPAFYW